MFRINKRQKIKGIIKSVEKVEEEMNDETEVYYLIRTEFYLKDVIYEVEDKFSERLFKHKIGNEIDVFLNFKDPFKSTINDQLLFDVFRIVPELIILVALIIASLYSKK